MLDMCGKCAEVSKNTLVLTPNELFELPPPPPNENDMMVSSSMIPSESRYGPGRARRG